MPLSMAAVAALIGVLCTAPSAWSILVPCGDRADAERITEALGRIRATVDPCGETAEIGAVLDRLAGCRTARYEICTSATAGRNVLDRRTITWNPDLRSELEAGGSPVLRDPTASLLHELVHVADACEGRNPGAYELEAVRIENIYRRAAGLAQRTRYGDYRLPAAMRRLCGPEACACTVPPATEIEAPIIPPSPAGPRAADSAPPPAGSDADSAR
ncbi:MAG TPA: hypothetical protein VKA21_04480 [Candidatus Binatia bacterium]|nr:hypothetical protein [Candidatus Binatia bacterium]